MKFKTYIKENASSSILCCLDWCNNDEVYTVGDGRQIYKWNSMTRDNSEVAKLPADFIPTDLHWLIGRSGGGKGSDSLLIASNDGRYIILNKTARVERNVTAHSSAITSARWSPDGAGLLTAGEDGAIKIWSRSGMLRSTVVQNDDPIRCARWYPNSSAIVYCQGGYISVKQLAANSKLIKWRAHEGLVLCLSWSSESLLIASGGEDCRYKIWDSQGANIFNSSAEDYPITSIEFSPYHNLLAVSGFNLLKLCDFSGWPYGNSRFNSTGFGSIYSISWSPDSTQIACGSANGTLIFGHVVEKQLISRNLKATTSGRKSVLLQDIVRATTDVLDFPERIINWALSYGHLVVATTNQIHVFNENYINTPIIIDGRSEVRILELAKKFFLVVDSSSIWIYSYSGRLHLNPRYPSSQAQIPTLTSKLISLGSDLLAVRDGVDTAVIHIFDLVPGATRQNEGYTINSKSTITDIAACRAGTIDDQFIVFIDMNRELFITRVQSGGEHTIFKIGTQVIAVKWASDSNILVGLHDSCYSVWYCPGESCSDPSLIALTTVTLDTSEFGRNISLEIFEGQAITFRSAGALYTVSINAYCEVLHRVIADNQWKQALKICRLAENVVLWATLAAIATKKNQHEISEEAYAAALQVDKVNYLQYIKSLPTSSPEQMAENSLIIGRLVEAETILLHNKKVKEAILLSLRMHQWNRALDIALKHDGDLELVLNERKKYLKALEQDEQNEKFLKVCEDSKKDSPEKFE